MPKCSLKFSNELYQFNKWNIPSLFQPPSSAGPLKKWPNSVIILLTEMLKHFSLKLLWLFDDILHSKNKVVKWTTLGLSNWCQKRTPQSRPKLVIWVSRRMTTLMSSQKQPESRQMTTFLLVSLSYDDLVITLERLNDKPQIVKWWSCD